MARNRKSLKYMAQQILEDKLRIGESKHQAKRDGSYKSYIYSFSTFSNYLKHSRYFIRLFENIENLFFFLQGGLEFTLLSR